MPRATRASRAAQEENAPPANAPARSEETALKKKKKKGSSRKKAAPAVEEEEENKHEQDHETEEKEEDAPPTPEKRQKKKSKKKSGKDKAPAAAMTPLGRLLDDAQRSFAAHPKCLERLGKLHAQDDEGFAQSLVPQLNKVLVVFKNERSVGRLVELITNYATHPCGDNERRDEFAMFLLTYLLARANAKDKAVRYRVCQMVGKTLNKMAEDAEIGEDVFEEVCEAMLTRARDKVPAVRVQAVLALCRLQAPDDEGDPVLAEYLRLLRLDSSKDVRRAVVLNLGISRVTLRHVLARTRDAAPEVRKAAFEVLRDKVDVGSLKTSQRATVMRSGLADRSAAVRAAAESLLADAWLKRRDGNAVALVAAVGVAEHPEAAAAVARALVRAASGRPAAGTPAPPYAAEGLRPAGALYWRALCEHLAAARRSDALEACLPDTVEFVRVLEACEGSAGLMEHLLPLSEHLDYSDEVGRQQMSAYLRRFLARASRGAEALVPPAMALLRRLHPSEDEHIQVVLELLSDIRDPLDRAETDEEAEARHDAERRYEALVAERDQAKGEMAMCVATEDFAGAAACKQRLVAVTAALEEAEGALGGAGGAQQDQNTWVCLLSIVAELLAHTRKSLRHSGLRQLLDNTILPPMARDDLDEDVRVLAVRCLGLYTLMDRAEARKFFPLFQQVIANDTSEVQASAFHAVLDILLVFKDLLDPPAAAAAPAHPAAAAATGDGVLLGAAGVAAVASAAGSGAGGGLDADDLDELDGAVADDGPPMPSMAEVVEGLAAFLIHGDTSAEQRSMIAEGIAKMLMFDRCSNPAVFSLLVLLFFNPSTADELDLRQCLSVFFPAYAAAGPGHRYVVRRAFLPTFQAVVRAPRGSPLRKVPLLPACQYFVYLTGLGRFGADEDAAHAAAAASSSRKEARELRFAVDAGLDTAAQLGFDVLVQLAAFPEDISVPAEKALSQTLKVLPVDAARAPAVARALADAARDCLSRGVLSEKTSVRCVTGWADAMAALAEQHAGDDADAFQQKVAAATAELERRTAAAAADTDSESEEEADGDGADGSEEEREERRKGARQGRSVAFASGDGHDAGEAPTKATKRLRRKRQSIGRVLSEAPPSSDDDDSEGAGDDGGDDAFDPRPVARRAGGGKKKARKSTGMSSSLASLKAANLKDKRKKGAAPRKRAAKAPAAARQEKMEEPDLDLDLDLDDSSGSEGLEELSSDSDSSDSE